MMAHLRPRVLCVLVLMLAASVLTLPAVGTEIARISLHATDMALGDVLTEIGKQADVEIVTSSTANISIDVDVTDVSIEQALRAVAVEANCSWIRLYALEPADGKRRQFTFSELLNLVRDERQAFVERLGPERSAEMQQVAREALASARSPNQEDSVGCYLADTGALGREDSDLDAAAGRFMTDPLHFASIPPLVDPASVSVAGANVTAFTDAMLESSGFVILDLLQGAEGTVTLELEDTPVDEIVAAAAEQLGCSHRRVYLLAPVRQLTMDEVEARMDGLFNMGVGYFWSQSPERRAELVNRVVRQAGNLSAEDRRQIRSSSLAKQVMAKFMDYCNSLPMDQRREMMPLLQEAAKLMGQ